MDNDSRWQRLINDGELPPPLRPAHRRFTPPLRCRQPDAADVWQAPHRAQGATFESICRRKNDLLTLAVALEDACEYMEPRRCLLMILDERLHAVALRRRQTRSCCSH